MALNLSNIKAEAIKDREAQTLAAEKLKKINDGVSKHREDLKKWFISLFPNEKVENNYVETHVTFEGGIKIVLGLNLVDQSSTGSMIKVDDRADFKFYKSKNGKVITSILILDMTDYVNLDPENPDYKYTYEDHGEKKTIKFPELEKILQAVIDK